MRVFLYPAILICLCANPGLAETGSLRGTVSHVRDGDTIEISGTAIRLQGIAAPALSESYGENTKHAMQELVRGQQVYCELTGEKSYDRWIGTCFLSDGTDLSAAIVAMGLARDCPRYS